MSIQVRSQSGKVALVTGSSRGIGVGIAIRLARQGAHVIINYRAQKDAAEWVVEQLGAEGLAAEARQADVAEPSQVAESLREIHVDHGRLKATGYVRRHRGSGFLPVQRRGVVDHRTIASSYWRQVYERLTARTAPQCRCSKNLCRSWLKPCRW
jgi:enoyl-[acyl-carrier-protein] reductase (NADH)